MLEAAGNRQNYLEDDNKQKREFDRKFILNKIYEAEVNEKNIAKLIEIMGEFAEK